MTRQHLPADDARHDQVEVVHAVDQDDVTTGIAVAIMSTALAAGHPDDPDAAAAVLRGPAAAVAVHGTLGRRGGPLETVFEHDEAAAALAAAAGEHARSARRTAEERAGLPQESTEMSDGVVLTLDQLQDAVESRARTAAQREEAGDFEHRVEPPGRAARWTVAAVLSVAETFLLLWPVTNASWRNALSVAYVAGLVVMFLLMNDWLPRHCGGAFRAHREVTDAAAETSRPAVALRAGRAGPGGRVDACVVRLRALHRVLWAIGLAVVLTVYAGVMYVRITTLAERIWDGGLVVLAALLITLFTAGAPVVLAWRWSRGNALGDQLRECGGLLAQARRTADDLADRARDEVERCRRAVEAARMEVVRGDQTLADGYRRIGVGLQKAAALLDLSVVPRPDPENLLPVTREARAQVLVTLDEVATICRYAERLLEREPLLPRSPAPDPWARRRRPGGARPDPAYAVEAHG
jgi:hypothetical protein